MLENIRYTNHLNETIMFDGSEHIYVAHGELRDYSWSYDTDNETLSNFNRRGVVEKSLPVKIFGNKQQSLTARNRLYEVIDADTTANIPGKLWFDDYYMGCYVSSSVKSRYMPDNLQIDLTLVTDTPYWTKEVTSEFRPLQLQSGLKYNKKYNFKYTDYSVNATVTNNTLTAAPFKIVIYGPCENPEIFIGSQQYKINTTLNQQEYLTLAAVDKEKTIYLTDAYGMRTNLFNKREKSVDVFAQIPNGTFDVTWDGNFSFDLTVFDRRNEPPWT